MIVAELFLIFDIGIAFLRAKGRAQRSGDYVNLDVLSVAFASLFFWLIPTVFLGSIIGVSQSAYSVPRILLHFSKISGEAALATAYVSQRDRELNGGIYSWQPKTRSLSPLRVSFRSINGTNYGTGLITYLRVITKGIARHIAPASTIVPVSITSLACITGFITAWYVPPVGFECRHLGMLFILFAWISSWLVGVFLLPSRSHPWHFSVVLLKDIVFAVSTLACLGLGQAGFCNCCFCYTIWGRVGIIIPGYANIRSILKSRIAKEYPAITIGAGIGTQLLIVPLLVYWYYSLAFRVFLRGDSGKDLPRAHRKVNTEMSEMSGGRTVLEQNYRVSRHDRASDRNFRWPSSIVPRRTGTTRGYEIVPGATGPSSRNPNEYSAISQVYRVSGFMIPKANTSRMRTYEFSHPEIAVQHFQVLTKCFGNPEHHW
jgi:hypothetical protein